MKHGNKWLTSFASFKALNVFCSQPSLSLINLVQVWLRTEVLRTPSSTRAGFKLMTSRSWQYISCHWNVCPNHLAISDFRLTLPCISLKNSLMHAFCYQKDLGATISSVAPILCSSGRSFSYIISPCSDPRKRSVNELTYWGYISLLLAWLPELSGPFE